MLKGRDSVLKEKRFGVEGKRFGVEGREIQC